MSPAPSPSTPPLISTTSHLLTLPDPLLPLFSLQITSLRSSLLLAIAPTFPAPDGTGTAGEAAQGGLMKDFGVAVWDQKRKVSSATSISPTSTHSTNIASKLSKRFNTQVFLSLDLSAIRGEGVNEERVVLGLEKVLVGVLDRELTK